MLKNFPSFSRLILHEAQDKKQRSWNLVEEADHSGEKISNAELKNLIFDKVPSQTAATFRNKQSDEKVKTWWAEVDGPMHLPVNSQFGRHFKNFPPRRF